MTKSDKKSLSLQDGSNRRERIACLKKIVDKKFLQRNIQRRNLDKRRSRKCPAYVMVWFTIAFWFYGDDCYTQVFRWLHRFSKSLMPSSSALTQARAKIGIGIMADVYRCIVQCLCTNDTPDAFYEELRIVAVDGFVLNVPDSEENRRAFGRPKNGNSYGAFPQVRIVTLCEVGSRVFFNFLAKPIRCGEVTLAKHVYRALPEKSLLLFDIGFCAYELMKIVIDRNGTVVRVIEYKLDDPQRVGHGEMHRLVTTLLDENEHPAETLIVLYHERWEEELGIDEAKTHFRKSPTLRSHRPAGVLQEVYGMLIAHFIIRKLAFEAAKKANISPRKISFTGTINVLRARLPEAPRSRHLIKEWYESLLEEVSLQVLENRRNRINPRVIKRPQSKWPKKQEKHRKLPCLERTFAETIDVVT